MKQIITGLLIIVMGMVFTGCSNPAGSTGTGSLIINITESVSRTLIPVVSMEPAGYDIAGTGPGGAAFTRTLNGALTASIDGLIAGEWVIAVTVKNAAGTAIGAGTGTAMVAPASAADVSITVIPYEGFGTLNLTLAWSAGQVQAAQVEAILLPAAGAARTLDFTVNSLDGTAGFSTDDIAAGYYTMVLKLKDNGRLTMGAVEVVRIIKDQTTTGSYTFTDINEAGYGSLQVNVAPEMADPLLTSISGASAAKSVDQSVNLSATATGYAGNATYVWYVNGDAVDTDADYTFGDSWAQGYYRIDVTAFSADGKRAGSAAAMIRVLSSVTPPLVIDDDFTGGTLDTAVWEYNPSYAQPVIADGTLILQPDNSLVRTKKFTVPCIIEGRGALSDTNISYCHFSVYALPIAGPHNNGDLYSAILTSAWERATLWTAIRHWTGTATIENIAANLAGETAMHDFRIEIENNRQRVFIDGSLAVSDTLSIPTGQECDFLAANWYAIGNTTLEWLKVYSNNLSTSFHSAWDY